MKANIVQQHLDQLSIYIPTPHPATGWYFSDAPANEAIQPELDRWVCMFDYFEQVMNGATVSFSKERTGCSGAACYQGFQPPSKEAGRFLADREKYKKNTVLGNAFYDGMSMVAIQSSHLCWASLDSIDKACDIEVVNLWIHADTLSDLVTLANFDRSSNDNVLIPFASGCQSIWTLPYNEKSSKEPKCIVGCIDPSMRQRIPSGVLSFSMPANRLLEMVEHIPRSFLQKTRS